MHEYTHFGVSITYPRWVFELQDTTWEYERSLCSRSMSHGSNPVPNRSHVRDVRPDFEALLLGHEIADLVPTQVVQDSSYCMGLEITALEPGCLCCNDKTEEPGPYAAVISEVTKMLAAKSESFVY